MPFWGMGEKKDEGHAGASDIMEKQLYAKDAAKHAFKSFIEVVPDNDDSSAIISCDDVRPLGVTLATSRPAASPTPTHRSAPTSPSANSGHSSAARR